MPRQTLPAPTQPDDDPNWSDRRKAERIAQQLTALEPDDPHIPILKGQLDGLRKDYLYWQHQEDAVEAAVAGGYEQRQGRPGEVLPYHPESPLAFLNPRQEQMEALARWAAANPATRGGAPSVDPDDPLDDRWAEGPLPYACGLASVP